jgi:adenine/guanine/hypoxanthine permease
VRRELLASATTFVTMDPAFLTLTVTPFTYSITNSPRLPLVRGAELLAGRSRELHPIMLGVSVVFLVYFVLGG